MNKQLKRTQRQELNEAYQKTLYWFFAFPDHEMSLSDLASELRISKTTTNHIVKKLVDDKFLLVTVLGRTWRIVCNKFHHYHTTIKIGYNLNTIYSCGIIEEIHKKLDPPRAIILFGSYRKGDDNEKSDMDIAVEVLDGEGLRIVELGFLPTVGYRKNIRVNLHIFSRNRIDINLFSNIANGIVLEGFLEVRP